MFELTRTAHRFEPDPTRTVTRPFLPGTTNFAGERGRIDRIVGRILDIPKRDREALLRSVRRSVDSRFEKIESVWEAHFQLAASLSSKAAAVEDRATRLLIGAYFTQTYAYEAAALTNPSIVPVGDPANGAQPFIMSARAIGEGHVSSIAFITGRVGAGGDLTFDPRHPLVSNGERHAPVYDRQAFSDRLVDLGFMDPAAEAVLAVLERRFTSGHFFKALETLLEADIDPTTAQDATKRLHWLADSNYELVFDGSKPISEHVISPAAPAESHGIEDARFVRFTEDDGSSIYYATYTAYDGMRILPQLIETRDFVTFRMSTVTGPTTQHKGMALFPRRVDDAYVALSRHDHETTFLIRSDNLRKWSSAEVLLTPELEWEAIQNGNCGSPIEIDDGWLVITHGVGPMRRYVLGAVLLDRDKPSKVIARLRRPLLEPDASERVGYVPDVVYSCGAMVHEGTLILPYGHADRGIRVAVGSVDELVAAMD